ncbi:MAG: hypothetical protein ACREM8_07125 [Vulcanimicrobiaceae bacterium]
MRRFTTLALAAVIALIGAPALAKTHTATGTAAAGVPSCPASDPVVWVNTSSNVYHMQGDKYFGKTKAGKYLCQSAANAAGAHQSKHAMTGKSANSSTNSMKSSTGRGAVTGPAAGAAGSTATTAPGAMNGSTSKHHRHHKAGATPNPSATGAPGAMSGSTSKHHRHRKSGATPAPSAT